MKIKHLVPVMPVRNGKVNGQDGVKLADNTENGFCTACFGGGYPTSIPKDGGKDHFECKISEGEKKKNA